MEGFDDPGIFFSDNFGGEEHQDANAINLQQIKKKFKEFIKTFNEDNFFYKYR
jgi:DNA replication licensing factor MCM5